MDEFLFASVGEHGAAVDVVGESFQERFDTKYNAFEERKVSVVSKRPVHVADDVIVGFGGYLTSHGQDPCAVVAEAYRRFGRSVSSVLEGSFRAFIWDRNRQRGLAFTDRFGNKVFYHTGSGEEVAVASHFAPLLRLDSVSNQLDRQSINHYLRSWHTAFSTGPLFFADINRLPAGHRLEIRDGGGLVQDMEDPDRVDGGVSDILTRMERLLQISTRFHLDSHDGAPSLLLSGGIDSTYTLSLLDEYTEQQVETFTYGWREEHFADAAGVASRFDTEHRELELPAALPDASKLWFDELPQNSFVFHPYRELADRGIERCWTGQNAQTVFPAGLEAFHRVEAVEPVVSPAVSFCDEHSCSVVPRRWLKGVGVCDRDHPSRAVVEDWSLPLPESAELVQGSSDRSLYRPCRVLEDRWSSRSEEVMDRLFRYQLRVTTAPRYAIYAQNLEHFDVFGYGPLVDFARRLSPRLRRKRLLLKRLASGRVPQQVLDREASGWGFVTDQMRRCLSADWSRYMEAIDSFLGRGFLDLEKAEEVLFPRNLADRDVVNMMMAVYNLERWLQAFYDREDTWRRV